MYSNADNLNVRSSMSIESEVKTKIPYGTLLEVIKTSSTFNDNGITYQWYQAPALNGFVLGKYIQPKKPNNDKSLVLRMDISSEDTPSAESFLTLANMKAKMITTAGGYDDYYKTEYYGQYSCIENYILLKWSKISCEHRNISKIENKLIEKNEIKPFDEKIYWISKYNFWVSAKTFEKMKSIKYKIIGKDNNKQVFFSMNGSFEGENEIYPGKDVQPTWTISIKK
jgi:uncharacterized protein YgiM (DUF1202 family)